MKEVFQCPVIFIVPNHNSMCFLFRDGAANGCPGTSVRIFRLVFLFFCIICVSGHSSGYSYTREALLNYRTTTPVDLFPVFVTSAVDKLPPLTLIQTHYPVLWSMHLFHSCTDHHLHSCIYQSA